MEKTIVEVKGIKMELDYREGTTTRIESYRVGSKVKVLTKAAYGEEYKVRPGVIVGFDAFEKLPTIKIAVVETGYGSNPIEFISYNSSMKDAELISADGDAELLVKKDTVIGTLTRNVENKRVELESAQEALRLFVKHFGEKVEATETA